MAIQSRVIGVMRDDVSGLTATVEVLWNDQNMRLDGLRGTNPTSRGIRLIARAVADGTEFSTTFPAGATTTRNIPGGQAAKFGVTIDANGRVDGVEYSIIWIVV